MPASIAFGGRQGCGRQHSGKGTTPGGPKEGHGLGSCDGLARSWASYVISYGTCLAFSVGAVWKWRQK